MKTLFASLGLAAMMLLGACGPDEGASLPAPLEPDDQAIAYFCRMNLTEHGGPKGQAFVRGQERPYWFASPGEAFTFLETELHANELLVLYVNDMRQGTWEHPAPGAWVEIRQASFVIGADVPTAMGDDGPSAMPFADKAAAEAFAAKNGGAVMDFEAAAKALAIDSPEPEHLSGDQGSAGHGDTHGG